ncbi:TetR/AcrR family transcriptional regulator [Cellulosimicrobium sp. CUA-896]|uniref:TetR/AcrR family transcriptional regulator n=1 Tax=Cellulosimicrobium sp. CUA-896 TaxID=1517881 RepID=UPI00095FE918|nr:TetR family transcriptional regulator [Cellulosimicrobium sp. CUA-896]OLT53433.1 TetR family transcriptional regulator [Cellulosimicrobium sp. CUA-896]
MRSTDEARPRRRGPVGPPEDLSTRARIRDAAILRFAREGFGASVRAIAADAEVSPALVLHHFGSKDGLRAACDEHVLATVRTTKHDVMADAAAMSPMSGWFAQVEEFAPAVGYALRSLQAGGAMARAFVDHMVADAAGYVREAVAAGVLVPSRDEEARARYLVLSAMGAMLLSLTLDPPEHPDDLAAATRRHVDAVALPTLELYTEGLLASRRMLDEYLLYVGDPPRDEDAASA